MDELFNSSLPRMAWKICGTTKALIHRLSIRWHLLCWELTTTCSAWPKKNWNPRKVCLKWWYDTPRCNNKIRRATETILNKVVRFHGCNYKRDKVVTTSKWIKIDQVSNNNQEECIQIQELDLICLEESHHPELSDSSAWEISKQVPLQLFDVLDNTPQLRSVYGAITCSCVFNGGF